MLGPIVSSVEADLVAHTIEMLRRAEETFQFHEVTSTDPQSLRNKEGPSGECMDFPGKGK